MEYSKKISDLVWKTVIILTTLAVIFPIFNLPVDGILNTLPYAWSAAAVVQAFYYWKSKNENRHKYAMLYVDKIAEHYGMESAIRIAEVVLKD